MAAPPKSIATIPLGVALSLSAKFILDTTSHYPPYAYRLNLLTGNIFVYTK